MKSGQPFPSEEGTQLIEFDSENRWRLNMQIFNRIYLKINTFTRMGLTFYLINLHDKHEVAASSYAIGRKHSHILLTQFTSKRHFIYDYICYIDCT